MLQLCIAKNLRETLVVYGKKVELSLFGIANALRHNALGEIAPGVLFGDEEEAMSLEIAYLEMAFYCWLFPLRRKWVSKDVFVKPSERYTSFFADLPPAEMETLLEQQVKAVKKELRMEAIRRKLGIATEKPEGYFNWHFMLRQLAVEKQKQCSSIFIAFAKEQQKKRYGGAAREKEYVYTEEKLIPVRLYSSATISPLAWAEILYAVENDILARPCSMCGNWFPLHKKQIGQQKFCSAKCRNKSKAERVKGKR